MRFIKPSLTILFRYCPGFKSSSANGKIIFATLGIVILMVLSTLTSAQTDSIQQKLVQAFNGINEKSLHVLDNKYSLLQKLVEKKTLKMLSRMQKKEASLHEQMKGKDSVKAKQLFADAEARYQQLLKKLQSPPTPGLAASYKEYIPGLDSMQTAMKFLSQGSGIPGIATSKLQQVTAISNQLQQLQGKLQVTNEVQDFIRQREQLLKNQLTQFGLAKKLVGVNKEVFYYQSQLAQYKNMLNDKQKMEETLLAAVRQMAAFQNFWQKYSILGSLFPMPENFGTAKALNGLQTMASSTADLRKLGASVSTDPNGSNMQQQIQKAQSTLDKLKEKVSSIGGTGGTGDMIMPDFQPNSQHTKAFLKRLEYGVNIQNVQSTALLPTSSTMALMIGYKISDKATAGIGASYILGWGRGLNDINFSNQGIGLRSFIDIKAKGSIWITGGFEYTYYQLFASLSDVYNINVWQKSALIGLTKKTSIGKQTANLQLLFDMLYSEEIPKGQPIIFRIGYTF